MARRVEEGDPPAVVVDLVGADVLGDPTRLGLDDRGGANGVEQGGLAVVDVPHDRDDRRARDELRLGVLVDLRLELLLVCVLDLHLTAELDADQLDRLVAQRLGDGDHLPRAHHDLHDLGHWLAEGGRDVLDGRARVDGDLARRGSGGLLGPFGLRRTLVARSAAVGPRASGLGVDDDAPLAAAG
jgi:hypothetical protein